MRRIALLCGLFLVTFSPAVAVQNRELCGTPSIPPDLAVGIELLAQQLVHPKATKTESLQIPIAFHVVYSGENGRVSDKQISSLIKNLNLAFRSSPFSFYLLQTDHTNNGYWYANCALNSTNDQQMKKHLARDPSRVLNIYSCIPGTNLLGFATFPFFYPESSFLHGVNLHPTVLPEGGNPNYGTYGDAAVHEVGHYLGLYHTFEGGCSDGDFVEDTPAQSSPHYNCPTFPDTCPNSPGHDDVRNFMNYSNDRCMLHFTQGQISRMIFQSQAFRPRMWKGLGANCFPELPSPRLIIARTEDYVANGKEWTRYIFNVSNSSSFPNALFSVAPNLPPCGLNSQSSRSWVNIFDENDNYLYGFCTLNASIQLNETWFAIAKGQTPPKFVYMTIEDRRCGLNYKSNLVSVPR